MTFSNAQFQFDSAIPDYLDDGPIIDSVTGEEIWDDDALCECEPDQNAEGYPTLYRKNCPRHSEPPCDQCGWQAVCPDCVGT